MPRPSCFGKLRRSGREARLAFPTVRSIPWNMPAVKTFIVEDSPIILDNLVATLEELAPVKVVASAPDEASAVRWLSDPGNACDLAIIDVFLKSGSGLGVLKALGSGAAQWTGKRVVLTNYATADIRQKCKALGADQVFDKSNELDELIAYCTRLVQGAPDSQPGALG